MRLLPDHVQRVVGLVLVRVLDAGLTPLKQGNWGSTLYVGDTLGK